MFIESEVADDPFEPEVLMRPALKEYALRLALLPHLLKSSAQDYDVRGRAALSIVLAARARFANGDLRQFENRRISHRPVLGAWPHQRLSQVAPQAVPGGD